jgi:hypothetical protein
LDIGSGRNVSAFFSVYSALDTIDLMKQLNKEMVDINSKIADLRNGKAHSCPNHDIDSQILALQMKYNSKNIEYAKAAAKGQALAPAIAAVCAGVGGFAK